MCRNSILLIILALLASPAAMSQSIEKLMDEALLLESDRRFRSASELYEQIIVAITESKGPHTTTLIEPLLGKARSLVARRRYDDAREALLLAQNIAHRQEGVYSTGQLEVIDEMAALNLMSGDIRQANKLQKFSFAISRDKYGVDNLDILPAHSRLIQWYMETGQYSEVRRELDKAMELVKEHSSEHDPRLIHYMRLVAKTRRLQGIWKSEKSLIEALEILDKNPDLPLDVKTDVYLELADAYVARRKPKKAVQYYSQVTLGEGQQTEPALIPITSSVSIRARQGERYSASFKIPLSEKDYGVMVTEGNLARPSLTRSTPTIGSPFQFSRGLLIGGLRLRPNLNFRRVKMTFEFTVTKSGKVKEVELLASNAPSKLDNFMRKVLAKIRYRPGLLEGIPIDTTKVQLTQTF